MPAVFLIPVIGGQTLEDEDHDGPKDSKGHDVLEVLEELFLFHVVTSCKDDWRQDVVVEDVVSELDVEVREDPNQWGSSDEP